MIGALLKARSAPYIALALVAASGAVYGYGRVHGYSDAEQDYQAAMSGALESQLKRVKETSKKDVAAAVRAATRGAKIAKDIGDIRRPVGDCNSGEWLRAYNAAIRIHVDNTGGVDGTTGTAPGGQ